MSYKYTSKVARIKVENDANLSLALRFMLEDIDRIANPKTPKDKGNLRQDILKQVLGKKARIVWNKDYAAAQEDKQFTNYTTSGTGPHYAENAVKEVVDNSHTYFKKAELI